MKKLFSQKSHTKLVTLTMVFIIFGGFLFFGNAHSAHAGVTDWVFGNLLEGVLALCGIFLKMANAVFVYCVNPVNMKLLVNGPKLYDSWKLIRDLLNISFILVLLYTAFTIIFQVDSSNKKIILTLVLMALLVNFSFPITRFIIDVSNTLMYTIINTLNNSAGDGSKALGEITRMTGIENLLNPDDPSIETLLASIVFVFIFALTLLATGLLLIVRMIALAILIIFSPIAFVATILPGTSSYASKWWTNLFNYALFGPVMMLMIYITISLMTGFQDDKTLITFVKNAKLSGEEPNFVGTMAYMSIPIVLLWIGMGTAQSMSIHGAGAIMGAAQKAAKWPAKLGLNMGGYGLHFINRKMAETKGLRYLSPMAIKDAWKQRTARADRKALSMSSGVVQNAMNNVIDRAATLNPFFAVARAYQGFKTKDKEGNRYGILKNLWDPLDRDKEDYEYMELQKYANEERKHFLEINDNGDFIIHQADQALRNKLPGAAGVLIAANGVLAKNNDFNVYAADRGMDTDPQKVKTQLIQELVETGMKKTSNIAQSLMATGQIAFNSGGFGYGGMGHFIKAGTEDAIDKRGDTINSKNFKTVDELKKLAEIAKKAGKKLEEVDFENTNKTFKSGFYFTTEKEQADTGASKFSNLEPQGRQRTSHPDSYYKMDNKGNVLDIHLGGEEIFKKATGSDITNVNRARDALQRHWQAFNRYMRGKTMANATSEDKAFSEKIDSIGGVTSAYLKRAWEFQQNLNIDGKLADEKFNEMWEELEKNGKLTNR